MPDHILRSQSDTIVQRRDWLTSVAATCVALSTGSLPSISFAEEQTTQAALEKNLLQVLTAAPGGSNVDKDHYLRNVGRGDEKVRFHYEVAAVEEMPATQLERVLQLAKIVWNPAIRADMWMQVKEDLADTQSEKGGLILADAKQPFQAIRSSVEREIEYINNLGLRTSHLGNRNTSYRMPAIVSENFPQIVDKH